MRILRNFVLAATGVLAVAGSAGAQPAAPSPDVESATVTENRILCVHQDAPTGSRLGAKKICHTNAEWKTIHANADQDMRYLQERYDNMQEGAALNAGH
jgi:hypothetical protein